MGMDPASVSALAAIIGPSLGGLFGGIAAPDGQELQSFKGTNFDPTRLGPGTWGLLQDYLDGMTTLAEKPITIRTTVPNLPSFRGGALPMPISVPAGDPNRMNPTLRTIDGVKFGRRTLTPGPVVPVPPGGVTPPPYPEIPNPVPDETGGSGPDVPTGPYATLHSGDIGRQGYSPNPNASGSVPGQVTATNSIDQMIASIELLLSGGGEGPNVVG